MLHKLPVDSTAIRWAMPDSMSFSRAKDLPLPDILPVGDVSVLKWQKTPSRFSFHHLGFVIPDFDVTMDILAKIPSLEKMGYNSVMLLVQGARNSTPPYVM